MNQNTTYNGWTNWDTWALQLNIDALGIEPSYFETFNEFIATVTNLSLYDEIDFENVNFQEIYHS